MSFTPAVAENLRQVLATAVVVPVVPFRADGRPPSRLLPESARQEISGILSTWGLK